MELSIDGAAEVVEKKKTRGIKINKKECSLISSTIPTTPTKPRKKRFFHVASRYLYALRFVVSGVGNQRIGKFAMSYVLEPVIDDVSRYRCARCS